MNAVWTHLRRLVASIMLVAVASFVLHGGAMARLHQHGRGSTACATPASGGHVHKAAAHDRVAPGTARVAHDHGNGVAHDHAADIVEDDVPGDRQAAGEGSSCCAGVCAAALIALGLDTASAPIGSSLTLVPASLRGSGIDPGGLKRPPRTPGIAEIG